MKKNGFTIRGRCISPELQDILNKMIKAIDKGKHFQIRQLYYNEIMDFLLDIREIETAERIAKYEYKYVISESRFFNTISLNTNNNYKPNRTARRAAAKQNRKRGK